MVRYARPLEVPFEPLAGVPTRAINTYARLWQLETWLRTMVYVELRALLGDDWGNALKSTSRRILADKSLTHMPTPEMNALSYSQLPQLIKLMSDHWGCFSSYFPPQALWAAKLQEVSQIRHRVAHFRVGHADDLTRVKQLLRDVDKGFWSFCTSYNAMAPILPQSRDPVASHFLDLDPLPWGEIEPGKWMQIGVREKSLPIGLNVRAQRRPWANAPLTPGEPGHLYDFYLFAQDGRGLDMRHLLEGTQPLHEHLAHFCLDSDAASIRVTIPSIIGADGVITLVQRLYDVAVQSLRRAPSPDPQAMDMLADAWPEYVLGPSNPLTFLDPQMPCSFFNV